MGNKCCAPDANITDDKVHRESIAYMAGGPRKSRKENHTQSLLKSRKAKLDHLRGNQQP